MAKHWWRGCKNAIILKKWAIPITIFLICSTVILTWKNEIASRSKSPPEFKKKNEYEYFNQWLIYNRDKTRPEFDRFIYSKLMDGGLGNQLYRFASLYGIGLWLNRSPVFQNGEYKVHEMDKELAAGFPNFHKKIFFLKPTQNEFDVEKVEPFDKVCCDYVHPKILFGYNNRRILMLNGNGGNFQNHKYFHYFRNKILELYKFGPEIVNNVTALKQQIFTNEDKSFKFCVHTRTGDFSNYGPSNASEVGPAINWILSLLPRLTKGGHNNNNDISLLLFGEDKPFLQSLKIQYIKKIYYILDHKMSRIEELHFAQRSCDLFLITASLSSYAFWMGYLMPEHRPIFFIRKYIDNQFTDTLDTLPPDWIPIEANWLNRTQ